MWKIIDWPQHPLSRNSHDQTLLLRRSTAVPSSPINFTPHTFCLCSDKCAERYSLFINPSLMFNHLQNNQAMKISSTYQGSSTNIFGDWGQPTQPHTLPPHMVSQKPFSSTASLKWVILNALDSYFWIRDQGITLKFSVKHIFFWLFVKWSAELLFWSAKMFIWSASPLFFLISKNYFFDQQELFFLTAELIFWSAKI
jgi:hypothetical protein